MLTSDIFLRWQMLFCVQKHIRHWKKMILICFSTSQERMTQFRFSRIFAFFFSFTFRFRILLSKQKHPSTRTPSYITVIQTQIQIRVLSAFPSNCAGFLLCRCFWRMKLENVLRRFCFSILWDLKRSWFKWHGSQVGCVVSIFLEIIRSFVLFLFLLKLGEISELVSGRNRNTWYNHPAVLPCPQRKTSALFQKATERMYSNWATVFHWMFDGNNWRRKGHYNFLRVHFFLNLCAILVEMLSSKWWKSCCWFPVQNMREPFVPNSEFCSKGHNLLYWLFQVPLKRKLSAVFWWKEVNSRETVLQQLNFSQKLDRTTQLK